MRPVWIIVETGAEMPLRIEPDFARLIRANSDRAQRGPQLKCSVGEQYTWCHIWKARACKINKDKQPCLRHHLTTTNMGSSEPHLINNNAGCFAIYASNAISNGQLNGPGGKPLNCGNGDRNSTPSFISEADQRQLHRLQRREQFCARNMKRTTTRLPCHPRVPNLESSGHCGTHEFVW